MASLPAAFYAHFFRCGYVDFSLINCGRNERRLQQHRSSPGQYYVFRVSKYNLRMTSNFSSISVNVDFLMTAFVTMSMRRRSEGDGNVRSFIRWKKLFKLQ